MSKISLLVTVMGSLILVGAGCGQTATPPVSKPPQANEQPPAPKAMPKAETPAALTAEQTTQLEAGKATHEPTTLTFDVTGGMFYFTPNEIRVKKDDKVKIIFRNAGGMHNFMLDEFNVKMDPVASGQTTAVEFTADKTGTFEYYCGVGKHRQMGQKGRLIVE